MKKLGFFTCELFPRLIDDDLIVKPFLARRGYEFEPVVWDQVPHNELKKFDGFIFRSCWNYHKKYPQFLEFLNVIENLKIPVHNSLDTIRWNLNKKHIIDLENNLLVPKTKYFKATEKMSTDTLNGIVQKWGADLLVIKPAVSLNGDETFLMSTDKLKKIQETIDRVLQTRDVLVQEYIPEIKTAGEISLIYFNNQFSHAIRKKAAAGEFRIHAEYGGTQEVIRPSAECLRYSEALLSELKIPLLYSRVDLVESSRGPVLIEFEATDPMLHLWVNNEVPERWAQAISEVF